MAYRSEIIALFAAGVSFKRLLRPYVVGAILLGIVSLLGNHWLVPLATKQMNRFKAKYIWSEQHYSPTDLRLRLSPHLYIYLHNFDYDNNKGNWFTAETIDGTLLKKKVLARSVDYDESRKIWILHDVAIRENDGLKETLVKKNKMEEKYNFSPKDLSVDASDYRQTLTTPQLIRYTQKQIERGKEDVTYFLIERYKRSAQPLAGLILTIIGVCISSVKIRGGSGLHLALGIVISALYILFLQFANTFATNAGLNPYIAVWLPNIIFGIVAYLLYRRRVN